MKRQKHFCPNCGSEDVAPDTRHTNVLGEAIFNVNKWHCRNCNYTGVMPEGESGEVEFDAEKQPEIDTDAGKAHLHLLKPLIFILVGFIMGSAILGILSLIQS